MREAFANAVSSRFTSHPFTVDRRCEAVLYAYDSATDHRTYLTDSDSQKDISLEISNVGEIELMHICIDGGMIEYGLEDYVGDGQPHGRCDCMLFNDAKLMFVEFKMNVETLKDKRIWQICNDAMGQIEDFSSHLKNVFHQYDDEFSNYYAKGHASALVCIKTAPAMNVRRNSQRLTAKDAFTSRTDLKIEYRTSVAF